LHQALFNPEEKLIGFLQQSSRGHDAPSHAMPSHVSRLFLHGLFEHGL
jgi:hypothetical protein